MVLSVEKPSHAKIPQNIEATSNSNKHNTTHSTKQLNTQADTPHNFSANLLNLLPKSHSFPIRFYFIVMYYSVIC